MPAMSKKLENNFLELLRQFANGCSRPVATKPLIWMTSNFGRRQTVGVRGIQRRKVIL